MTHVWLYGTDGSRSSHICHDCCEIGGEREKGKTSASMDFVAFVVSQSAEILSPGEADNLKAEALRPLWRSVAECEDV